MTRAFFSSGRPARFSRSTREVAWTVAAAAAAVIAVFRAADANDGQVRELTGAVATSIFVPPVRTQPPARTLRIERPEQYDPETARRKQQLPYKVESLRLAIEDLRATFGDAYPRGAEYLRACERLRAAVADGAPGAAEQYEELRDAALLANPLLSAERMLVLKRKCGQLGLPTNHQCNTCLKQLGYDNELALLSPVHQGGVLRTLYRPRRPFFVGETDLNFDADRLLFTMPNGRTWQIHEIGIDGQGLRQVSRETAADVDHFDGCYLPDGRIAYCSTASFTGVPCWHGRERACCIYTMDATGGDVRQACFDQDLDLHPSVLDNGQIIFSRWEYSGILHAYLRPLIVMNPDGTSQRAVYGSNSYYPNSLFFPRAIPGHPTKLVAVLAGYHGLNRMGELVVLDTAVGWAGPDGIVHRITRRGEPIVPVALDRLTENARDQFLHPYALSDKYFLTAMQPGRNGSWGIYLVDVFDNVVPILVDSDYDFFEPILVKRRPRPPVLADRTDRSRDDAVVVVHDVHAGKGLAGVPRGTITKLRVAAYNYGFPGMAGPDKIGRAGPWEAIRILGTVPVYADGSAKFRVPANTPITLQALDEEGKAVQLMRSWYTAMPGETASCVGCHETPRDTPVARGDAASQRPIAEIEPWYGPARGFDFAREVQPVLDRYCVACHDGTGKADDRRSLPDLRDLSLVGAYLGLPMTKLGATRLDPSLAKAFPDRFSPCGVMPEPYGHLRTLYTPAYEALIPFVRRPNVEDGVGLLVPGEYHADTSELMQLLSKGHHGVVLDAESLDRLVTWIDLNGPCHGTWSDVAEIPGRADQRRHALAQLHGGPKLDPETVPAVSAEDRAPVRPGDRTPSLDERRKTIEKLLARLPESPTAAIAEPETMRLDLGHGRALELVRVPAAPFVMGDLTGTGSPDEWPPAIVDLPRPYWIGRTEVTNGQLRSIFPEHTSGWFTKRQVDFDGPGILLDDPDQPAVRVSWDQAMAFCRKLSDRTGLRVTLPTEAQWEHAARAGTTTPLWYGQPTDDFSRWANMADRSLTCIYAGTAGVAVLQPIPAVMECDDEAIATARVASYAANPWGLFDVHGNAAEWTRSAYRPYPYDAADGRDDGNTAGAGAGATAIKRVVRGGSYCDRPHRCGSAHRRAFPAWQAVHDVGFRIVIEEER
ncbi:MAG: hypothetical protein FJ276_14420 [Planctomycetes bacterium]|nr:hypothetical protein [Planctomycetota bacterium]